MGQGERESWDTCTYKSRGADASYSCEDEVKEWSDESINQRCILYRTYKYKLQEILNHEKLIISPGYLVILSKKYFHWY